MIKELALQSVLHLFLALQSFVAMSACMDMVSVFVVFESIRY